jgi:hypothetical protein
MPQCARFSRSDWKKQVIPVGCAYDLASKMDQETRRGAAKNSPHAAARFVRRGAEAIRAGSAGISQYRAEYQALIHWADAGGVLVPFRYIEQFAFIGDGAEHRVYKDDRTDLFRAYAIKTTHTNKFGYSTRDEGRWASPVEYLKRLAWQNFFFGDDIRIIGVAHEDGQLEVITSQPWIDVHPTKPNPSQDEIDVYMGQSGFLSTSMDLDTPIYFNPGFNLIAADAHDRNVLRDHSGVLCAIDLVIGPPSRTMKERMEHFFKSPDLPF